MELTFEFFLAWIKSWFTVQKPSPLPQSLGLATATPVHEVHVASFARPRAVATNLFFAVVRAEFGKLTQDQVNGYNVLLAKWMEVKCPVEHFAYMLATAYHETDATMQPIEEYGKGAGRDYGKRDPVTKKKYYGRGYVQLTWKTNYEKYGIALRPERALEPELAAHIMFDGMTKGIFTGRKLSDYFKTGSSDPINARRIINGTDKAEKIAGYYGSYLKALAALTAPEIKPLA